MQLELTPEQDQLRESVREVLDRECPTSVVRDLVERGAPAEALWRRMVELGWPAICVPEEAGGLGLGFVELAVVVEELGRHLAPPPYLATVTQFVPLIRAVGNPEQQARLLGAVVDGRTGAVAIAGDPARWDPAAPGMVAERRGDAHRLHGTAYQVLDGATADEIAVVTQSAVFVVPRAQLTTKAADSVDASRPYAAVTADDVEVPADRVLRADRTAVAAALEQATVALALDVVGACQAAFDIALAYAKVREQFGVPIGSFQALKHRFADLHISLERARATAYFAALAIAEDDPRRALAASMAKAAAGDCQRLVGQDAIQLLGGIGYTWEHDIHLYAKRAKSGELLLGGAAWHRSRVADLIGLRRQERTKD